MNDAQTSIIVAIIVAFVVFLIIRELMCWYWKINRIVEILESIKKDIENDKEQMKLS